MALVVFLVIVCAFSLVALAYRDRLRAAVEQWRYTRARRIWVTRDWVLEGVLGDAEELLEGTYEAYGALPLKRGEVVLYSFPAHLVEPRRQGGSSVGMHYGTSSRTNSPGGRRYSGISTRQYIPGAEVATTLDPGTITITNLRVVFAGSQHAREWYFDKIIGQLSHDPKTKTVSIPVSNRQKVSGFRYAGESELMHWRLALVSAVAAGDLEGFSEDMRERLNDHRAARPERPPAYSPG